MEEKAMTNNDINRFLNEMQENEEYALRVAQAKTPEALAALFDEININISLEESAEYLAQAQAQLDSGELNEEMLEAVNGGFGLLYLAKCAAFGGAAGVVLGLVAVGLYYAYRKSQRG